MVGSRATYTPSMLTYSNYLPIYGSHINESKICADCHTLVVNSVVREIILVFNMLNKQLITSGLIQHFLAWVLIF